MKLFNGLVTLLLVICGFTSCTSTINMPLDYAKLSDGFINSGSYDFGHVFIWDIETNHIASIYRIKPDNVPSATVDFGPRYESKESSVSHDTQLEVGAATTVTEAVKIGASAQFIDSTEVALKNFNPREYRDATYVLNSPELRTWRESLQQYASPKYRFIFISRVTDGDEIRVARKSSGESNIDANLLQYGQYTFKVTYDNKTAATIKASQGPMVIKPSIYTFRINGDSYRFFLDLNSSFSFQTAKQ